MGCLTRVNEKGARRIRKSFYAQIGLPALLLGLLQSSVFAQVQKPVSLISSSERRAQQSKDRRQPESTKESKRIFGVVPAYSITDAQDALPLTDKDKFGLFVKGTLDPFPFVAYAMQAGISQATDTHNGYGQGAAGYGSRFGAALADGTSARFFSTFAFPSLLHQDPRYFRKGSGSSWSRARYSISRAFVTRGDSGGAQPNWSNVLGKFGGAGLSNLYYPQEDRGATLTLTRVAIGFSYQMLGNLAIEFWPDIHRRIRRGDRKQ